MKNLTNTSNNYDNFIFIVKASIRTFSEQRQHDTEKVSKFKDKTDTLTKYTCTTDQRLDIIQNAIEDLELTEEPIDKYYKMDKVLGAGKYGVVKKGHSIANPDFKVAVKTISLQNLTSQFHSIVQEILSLKN